MRYDEVGGETDDAIGFVRSIEAVSAEPPEGIAPPGRADRRPAGDGVDDTFLGVGPGTLLGFRAVLRNEVIAPADYDQIFQPHAARGRRRRDAARAHHPRDRPARPASTRARRPPPTRAPTRARRLRPTGAETPRAAADPHLASCAALLGAGEDRERADDGEQRRDRGAEQAEGGHDAEGGEREPERGQDGREARDLLGQPRAQVLATPRPTPRRPPPRGAGAPRGWRARRARRCRASGSARRAARRAGMRPRTSMSASSESGWWRSAPSSPRRWSSATRPRR
ncbi:MAG: hypothetical protein M5U28_27040 [Sandaracinaceae bacterium]|nr:hypothetical protein [Sandaracinaceae bacterium]